MEAMNDRTTAIPHEPRDMVSIVTVSSPSHQRVGERGKGLQPASQDAAPSEQPVPPADSHHCSTVRGSGRGPCTRSYSVARRISVASLKGLPRNSRPIGKPSRSNVHGTTIAGRPLTELIALSRVPVSVVPIGGAPSDFVG